MVVRPIRKYLDTALHKINIKSLTVLERIKLHYSLTVNVYLAPDPIRAKGVPPQN